MDHSPPRAGDAGFALIEAVISAVVLAVVALAVLSGIEGSLHSAGRERSRSVASTLAEQDQERMRAMSADQLADMASVTKTVTVGNIKYDVTSTSQWIRDDTGGTVSCTNNSAQVDYLQIATTVKSKTVGTTVKPVAMMSLVAPPVGKAKGTLAVQVNNRDSIGIAGLDVVATAASGGSFTETTNALGCAIFTRVPVDSYSVTLNRAGWVDTFGRNPGTAGAQVLNNAVQVITMKFDRAASVAWSVTTTDPWSATPTASVASTPPLTLTNAATGATQAGSVSALDGEEPTAQRTWTTTPATAMFPFLSKYAMWTGSCSQSNPATWDSDYYDTFPGSIATQPGTAHTLTPAMQQPSLKGTLQDRNGAVLPTTLSSSVYATVRPDPTDPTPCSETYRLTNSVLPNGTAGVIGQWRNVAAPIAYIPPALPFGKYDICAKYVSSGGTARWRIVNNVDMSTMASPNIGAIKIDQYTTNPGTTAIPCPA
jgi:Tfp pilus assembly protein PilV